MANNHLPGKKALARRFMHNFNVSIANPGQAITQQQANQVFTNIIGLLGAAIVMDGGFELRGLGTVEVKQGSRKLKRNPRTGEVMKDENGADIYYSQKAAHIKFSSAIKDGLKVS